jgi:hypothetical protein
MLLVLLAFWMASASPDFDFYVKSVEPIFLKPREGAARCYSCHSMEHQTG